MDGDFSEIELQMAIKSFANKSSDELEEFLTLESLFGDWSFGRALAAAAKRILLERSDKILLENGDELKSET